MRPGSEQSTEVLVLILPEIIAIHCERRKPRFLHSLDFLDEHRTSRHCKGLEVKQYRRIHLPKDAATKGGDCGDARTRSRPNHERVEHINYSENLPFHFP